MNKEEIEQYKNITQEIFKKQYNSIKDLGNRELRKVIENSNWNFILQIIRHLENEIFILKEENQELQNRIDKAIEYIEEHKRKDEFLELNEWETRDLLSILKGGKE